MIVAVSVALFVTLTFFRKIDALGPWVALLVTHGIFVRVLGPSAIHLPFLSGLAMTAVILVRGQWSGVRGETLYLFMGLIGLMFLAGVLGINTESSLFSLFLYLKVFLLTFLIIGCVKTVRDVKIIITYCLIGLVIGAFYTVYQHLTGDYVINTLNSKRAAGLRGDPNETAMLMVGGIPLALYWTANSKSKLLKLTGTFTVLVLLIGIGLTQSRGAFLTLLVLFGLMFMRKPSFKVAVIGVVFVVFAALIAPSNYWDRMQTLVDGDSKGAVSLSGRTLLLQKGVKIIINNPVLGVGPGNFGYEFANIARAGFGLSNDKRHAGVEEGKKAVAHNTYIEFFAENGVIAGIILIVIFITAMRHLLLLDKIYLERSKHFGLGFCIALSIFGLLFAGLFLSQGKNTVLWSLVGLGFVAGQIKTKMLMQKKSSSAALS